MRVVAPHRLEQQGRVGHGRGERPGLVEARGVGHDPVARHPPVGRPQARPRRTAPPAGGSTRRCRCRWPGARTGRPPPPRCRPTTRPAPGSCPRGWPSGRTPSSRSSCPWRTRRGWSCRSPPRRPPAAGPRRSSRTAAASPPGSATRRSSAGPWVQNMSFTATGTPASGPSSSPRARAASTSAAAARAASPPTQRNDRTSPSSASMRARWASVTSTADTSPRADQPGQLRRRAPDQPSEELTPPPPGSGAPGSARPPRPAPWPARRPGSRLGAALVGPQHVDQRDRMRRRRHPRRVEGGHLGGVLEDGAELDGELLDLLLGQGEPGELATWTTSSLVRGLDTARIVGAGGFGLRGVLGGQRPLSALLYRFVRFWYITSGETLGKGSWGCESSL